MVYHYQTQFYDLWSHDFVVPNHIDINYPVTKFQTITTITETHLKDKALSDIYSTKFHWAIAMVSKLNIRNNKMLRREDQYSSFSVISNIQKYISHPITFFSGSDSNPWSHCLKPTLLNTRPQRFQTILHS